MSAYDFNILYYINIYKKWWRRILKIMAISVFFTVLISVFLPVNYISTVTILSMDMTGPTQIGGTIGKFLGLTTVSSYNSDIIISILKSRRMANDIKEAFHIDKKRDFKYNIQIRQMPAGMAIDVKARDPILTKDIANFIVQNLDKINTELEITAIKPMVKVLDFATEGICESKKILRKSFIAALFSFLLVSVYAFFEDYFKKLKNKV